MIGVDLTLIKESSAGRLSLVTASLIMILHFLKIPKESLSPGLVVMGGGLRSEGCGFESQQRMLDGHLTNQDDQNNIE